jgi:DNA-binding transcriptional LysR family regulator
MENARESLGHLGKWGRGRLRIGASTTACQHLIPPVLREFKESFPDHAITIEPGDTSALVSALLRHRIDLAIAIEPSKEPQLEFHPLFNDELHFITGALHPWAKSRRVERSEVPKQNYILYNKHSITFRIIEEYFRREEMVLNTVIELGTMEAIKELVKLGLGVSILAPWIARREIDEGSLVALSIGRRKLERRWGILHWRGKRLDLAEETFIGLCESAAASFRNSIPVPV